MYPCIIPPRIFLSVGVGLLIVSLVLGWISFSVPDWLQFTERTGLNNFTTNNSSNDKLPQDDNWSDLKKFGLWYKCVFSVSANDFFCTLWNRDAPSFVRVAQVLIPFGLSLGCLSLLSAIIGFLSRRAFITAVLFAALFAFLSFIFTTIGMTVFATESLVYVARLRLSNNVNPRRWGMWLITPNIVLSLFASICFILASIFTWCDYRMMRVTGSFNHSADKYSGSVFKAPSDSSNITTIAKRPHPYLQHQGNPAQDYPTTCYQLSGANNQNPLGYPPPPSYNTPAHQHGNLGAYNPAFQPAPGLFGYSRPSSPAHGHGNYDPYHNRHLTTVSSEVDDILRTARSRRRSRSRHRSSHRSRSHSPRENASGANHSQDNNQKQPQFIPIPVPYYQPPSQAPSQPSIQTSNTSSNNNHNNNNNNNTNGSITSAQPMTYVIQQPKQQFVEEIIQSVPKATNMLTYSSGNPSLVVSNPNQPIYTISYRTSNPNGNTGSVLASNIITGPAATTYVTAARNQIAAVSSLNSDSDEDRTYRILPKRSNLKKITSGETWTWRKL